MPSNPAAPWPNAAPPLSVALHPGLGPGSSLPAQLERDGETLKLRLGPPSGAVLRLVWAFEREGRKRMGNADDIANAVAYLASEEASFMTGTHMLVDGGLTIGQRHAWDPEAPGLFDALIAMEDAAKAGAAA